MSEDHIFYVYEHWRPDLGQCFYVGKGCGKRAWEMKSGRNCHHKAITAKILRAGMAIDVRVIASSLSELAALSLEIDRISLHGISNLTNMTTGGGGISNPTREIRDKMSAAKLGHKLCVGRKHTDAAKAKIGASSKGRQARLGKKHSQETKDRLRDIGLSNIDTLRKFSNLGPIASAKKISCIDDEVTFCSASEAARYYGASKSAVIEMCLGKNGRKSVSGHKFKYVENA